MRIAIVAGARSRESLSALLSCLFTLDVIYLRTHPRTPALYESGVRYRRERDVAEELHHQEERWRTVPAVLQGGHGDCEDLSCFRAAELVVSGEDVAARPYPKPIIPGVWHIVVLRGDGSFEDPSRALGMSARSRS